MTKLVLKCFCGSHFKKVPIVEDKYSKDLHDEGFELFSCEHGTVFDGSCIGKVAIKGTKGYATHHRTWNWFQVTIHNADSDLPELEAGYRELCDSNRVYIIDDPLKSSDKPDDRYPIKTGCPGCGEGPWYQGAHPTDLDCSNPRCEWHKKSKQPEISVAGVAIDSEHVLYENQYKWGHLKR